MKKFAFVLILLLAIAVIISAQENDVFPVIADYAETDALFSGVSGSELSSSEMKQKKGEIAPVVIIAGALTAYGAGCIIYKFATGRDYTSDIRKKSIRLYKKTSRTIRSSRDYGWRRRIYSGSW